MSTICVTGAANGIGKATKELLQSRGHTVIGVDLKGADVSADLSSTEGRQAAIEGVLSACGGRLDGLAQCAGVNGMGGIDLTVKVNFFGVMALANGLREALSKGTNPAMVLVSSNSTTMTPGLPVDDGLYYLSHTEEECIEHFQGRGWMTYPAGKLAVAFWIRMNAVKPEWLGAGIRVNGIAPGIIDTQMTQQAATNELTKGAFEQIPIPINRWGKPEEMAEPIAFLLSTASSYIVGQTIFADGGIDALLQPTAHPHPLPPLK